MAWDFETEPEYEAKLAWARSFVDDEIIPLETLSLDDATLAKDDRAAPRAGEERGPLGRAPASRARRDGLRAGAPRPSPRGARAHLPRSHGLREQRRRTPATPSCWRSGSRRSGREEQRTSSSSPCSTEGLRSAFSMTEPGAGADPTLIATTAQRDGEEWVINGHKWFTSNGSVADFLIVMCVTNPDVHPYAGCSMIIVPADTAGGRHGPRHLDHGGPDPALRQVRGPHRDRLQRRPGAGGQPRRARRRRFPARPDAPRPRPHPSLHEMARAVAARLRHALRARRLAPSARIAPRRQADGPELGRRLDGRDDCGPPHDPCRPHGRSTATVHPLRASRSR